MLDSKQDSLFNMIYFLLEKVIRWAQMPVNCLRASKLVTLGYKFDNALFDKCLQYFCLNIQQVMLRVLNIKLKNLAFDASKIITNAMFSIDKEVNTISNYGQHHRDVYVQTRKTCFILLQFIYVSILI